MAGTIAFIGCGAMGAPMAERLIDGGFALRIFDVNKEAMRSLVERGAVAADSPREAA
ncbi:MAG: NAD(P)-binding domain-containing protein, partial [Pseudolabrys sp.]